MPGSRGGLQPVTALEGTVVADNADIEGEVDLGEGYSGAHLLTLNGVVFTCGDELPVSTFIRYADNDFSAVHHVLKRLVHPDQHEEMWDAFEALSQKEVEDAIKDLIAGYAPNRPTRRAASSSGGSHSTKKKSRTS